LSYSRSVCRFCYQGARRRPSRKLDKAKAAGASEEAARQSASAEQDTQAKLAAEIQKLKAEVDAKTATVTPSTVTASVPVPVPVAPQGTSCGSNVSAGPNTTCPFALNVADEYLTEGGGTISIVMYSPVTGLDYTMSCVAGVPSICRGGNNAVVYIR
jgi:Flp pilus assembly protein TadG